MNQQYTWLLLLMLIPVSAISQEIDINAPTGSGRLPNGDYNPLKAPSTYQSPDNPVYWKNNERIDADYWQQDVHYKIHAQLDDEANTVSGHDTLHYYNNSPDTLNEVYFHLYQNAFQPGSYYHLYNLANNRKPSYGPYEQQKLGTIVRNLKMNGIEAKTQLDNTILRVELPEPVKPGDSCTFTMRFKTFFDNADLRRRMKMYKHHGVKHFNGVLWYPRIAVYDHKVGWQTDQHLGKEFYGEFGTFDVQLTLPREYIVQGTGTLVNKSEALPDELLELIAIENYDDATNAEVKDQLDEYYAAQDSLQTWQYHAENVHDFAFTTDPSYRMGVTRTRGIRCVALVQAHKAKNWLEVSDFTAEVVNTYEEQFGPYPYPKVVVADARDGMEYPMVTLCGGTTPDNYGLIAHEVGHMWFHSTVGTNEAYRAAMDEGFTQMLTVQGLNAAAGKYHATPNRDNWYRRAFTDSITNRDENVYAWYLTKAIQGDDARLNVHSHKYDAETGHGGGYRQVYYKMATMLYNLEYVLGEERFTRAMKQYFREWRIAHPYMEDFRQSIAEYSGVDLTWFFDQWLTTKKRIDYSIKQVQKGDEEGDYTVTFERKGAMEMPIAFKVVTDAGEEKRYLIPNREFVKDTDATVLPAWTGWGTKFNTTYRAELELAGKPIRIEIDPSDRLADVNQLDNSWKATNQTDLSFDSYVYNYPDVHDYDLRWRPALWFNNINGLKPGLHLEGDYMAYKHQFDFTAWYNSEVLQQTSDSRFSDTDDPDRLPVNFDVNYRTPLQGLDDKLFIDAGGKALAGYHEGHLTLDKRFGNGDQLSVGFEAAVRPDPEDVDFTLYPTQWDQQGGQWNNRFMISYQHPYAYIGGGGDIQLRLRSSAFTTDFDYSTLNLTAVNNHRLGQLAIRARSHLEYSFGTRIAPASRLMLAGARSERLMDEPLTRARGYIPDDWLGFGPEVNNFHYGGGLNLRGYAGYQAPYSLNGDQELTFQGTAGGALNVEVEFDDYIPLLAGSSLSRFFSLDAYAFGDVGVINANSISSSLELANVRGDAGLGTALTIDQWGPLDEAKPLTLRLDAPLYLSHVPADGGDNFDLRWLVGLERAF